MRSEVEEEACNVFSRYLSHQKHKPNPKIMERG
jgi:hypothetical protein